MRNVIELAWMRFQTEEKEVSECGCGGCCPSCSNVHVKVQEFASKLDDSDCKFLDGANKKDLDFWLDVFSTRNI